MISLIEKIEHCFLENDISHLKLETGPKTVKLCSRILSLELITYIFLSFAFAFLFFKTEGLAQLGMLVGVPVSIYFLRASTRYLNTVDISLDSNEIKISSQIYSTSFTYSLSHLSDIKVYFRDISPRYKRYKIKAVLENGTTVRILDLENKELACLIVEFLNKAAKIK